MIQRLEVTYGENARSDLDGIFKSTVESGGHPDVAFNFVLRIERRCQKIGNVPHGGRPRDDLYPGLRTVPFERSAVIAYIVTDGKVRILNVFYGGRDFEAIVRDEREGKPAKPD